MKANLLREAIRVAMSKRESHPMHLRGYKLYSFVVEHNKLLGYGVNNRDSIVKIHYGYNKRARGWATDFVTAEHAEISAWRKCRGLIESSFELINIRITDAGKIAMSCPCPCCRDWIVANGCTGVHFTTGSGWARMSLTSP